MTVLPGLLRQGHHQWYELCGWDSAPSQQIWLKHLKFCSLCSEWATPSSGENTCSMLNFFGRITPKRKLISDTELKKKKNGVGGGGSKVGEVGRISMALVLEKSRGMSEFRHVSTQSQKFLPGGILGLLFSIHPCFPWHCLHSHALTTSPIPEVNPGSSRVTISVEENFPFLKLLVKDLKLIH